MLCFYLFGLAVHLGIVFVIRFDLLFGDFNLSPEILWIDLKVDHADFLRYSILLFVFFEIGFQLGLVNFHGVFEIFRVELNKGNFHFFVGKCVVFQDFPVCDIEEGKKKLLEFLVQQFRCDAGLKIFRFHVVVAEERLVSSHVEPPVYLECGVVHDRFLDFLFRYIKAQLFCGLAHEPLCDQ